MHDFDFYWHNFLGFFYFCVVQRSESIAAWMNGLEIAYLRADLLSRELMLNTDISTQFIVAPLMDAQKREGAYIRSKRTINASLTVITPSHQWTANR